jgi:uncharacterized protein (TIGR03083 family)
MEITEHISAIQRDGTLLAEAARRAGLDADVPSCPGWRVRDLLRHQSYVHRWAAGYVANRHPDRVPRMTEAELLAAGPDDAGLIDWFVAGHEALVGTLRGAEPGLECWSFLPAPSPLAFWARRQAHETAIHRVDAELAAGSVTPFPADFAADGIDELIMGFFGRDARGEMPGQRILAVDAADAGTQWLIGLTPDGAGVAAVQRGRGRAECTVTGPAAALYRLMWNRATVTGEGIAVGGDPDVLRLWRDGMHVTWG